MSFSIQQLCRGVSSSSSVSSSQFVLQVDGQDWDLSNLVLSADDAAITTSEPPPPPSQVVEHFNNICSSSDDSSLISEAMLAMVSPSPPPPRQRKQAPQRQSSLTKFCTQTYYPKEPELPQDDDQVDIGMNDRQPQHHHHDRRRTRQDMEVTSQIVEEEDVDMMCEDQHDVFRSMDPPQQVVPTLSQQHRTATFDDCSSLSSHSAMVMTTSAPSPPRRAQPPPPATTTTWIEVMPEQFLPLVGDSHATWQAIISNNVHQVSCAICQTQQYCMTSISTVFCSSCRSLFPNVHFVSGAGGLGLGMPMEDAHRELKRRNIKRPPPTTTTTACSVSSSQKQQHDDLSHRSCGSSSGSANASSFHGMATATTTPH
jgi:hypothetical protein